MQVSIPIKPWHVFTISEVKSDVLPPAFLFVSVEITISVRHYKESLCSPSDVYKFGTQCTHTLYTIQKILQPL